MTDDDLYRKLQQHLDRAPVPFPATKSGVEIRILKHLFSPDDARVAVELSLIPEPVSVIHKRLGRKITRAALTERLERMAERGVVRGVRGKGGPKFGKTLFVVGFYEAQVNRLTADFERDVLQYFDEGYAPALHSSRTPQMRTVPVNRVIAAPDRPVGRRDDIATIVRTSKGPFAVMNCICQQGKDVLSQPCRQTANREHCLLLGPTATGLVARGDARFVSREEMLALLEQADRDGLVLQPQNTENPLFVCCCCGCCCAVLTTAKKLPRPAEFFRCNYHARVATDLCQACATCTMRCQMEAVTTDGICARVDLGRCIGCGLCVSTCPSGAIALEPNEQEYRPPSDTGRLYTQMFRERYGTIGLAAALGRKLLGMKT